jgi:hypothetical protein
MKMLEFYKNKETINIHALKVLEFLEAAAQPGDNWLVILAAKEIRSANANAYLWGHIYPIISDATGYTKEEIHNYCKANFLGFEKISYHNFAMNTVQEISVLRSSAKLSPTRFSEFIRNIKSDFSEKLNLTFDDFEHFIQNNPAEVEKYTQQYIYDKAK